MIRPAISPRRITGSATAGIVNAARSGVRNIKDITETISNEPEAVSYTHLTLPTILRV